MIRLLIAFLCLAASACAATRIASVSGNWADTATWGGSAAPVTGDWAQINGDITVTIPTGTSAACTRVYIGLTNNSSATATLVIEGTLTLDASGQLRIGDSTTASRDGILTFGPGGTLAGAGSIYFNQGKMMSTATQANPAKVTGSLALATLATGPKQYVDIANVSFQNTGTMAWNLQNTLGAFTSQFVAQNCVFSGNAAITVGSTDSPNTTVISIKNCDFREGTGGKSITLRRATGGAALFEFRSNTVWQTSGPYEIKPTTSAGLVVRGNVLHNVQLTDASTSGGMDVGDNFWSSTINTPTLWVASDAGVGSTYEYNYLLGLAAGDNLRGLIPTGSGGSGTNTVRYNVMEGQSDATHDKPDLIVARGDSIPLAVTNNLVIWAGEVVSGGRVATWSNTLNIKNNTIADTTTYTSPGVGHIYVPEGYANTGTTNLASNLVLGVDDAGDITIDGSTSGAAQAVTSSDYGTFYRMAVPYNQTASLTVSAGNTTKTVPAAHETADNPQFFDVTRNAARWNSIFGSGTATQEACAAYLAGLNGYRGTPNFDQNGTAAAYTPRQMLDWVAAGFSPTNLALRGSGDPADGSPDRGAMPVRTIAGSFF